MRTATKIIFYALLALIVLLGFQCSRGFERVTETVDLGYSAQAKMNPYLAAGRYLKERGFEVEATVLLDDADRLTIDDTLLLAEASIIHKEERLNRLLSWVEDGGFLVVGAETTLDPEREDTILDWLDVEVYNPKNQDYRNFYFADAPYHPVKKDTSENPLWYEHWGWPQTQSYETSPRHQQQKYNRNFERIATTLYVTRKADFSTVKVNMSRALAVWHYAIMDEQNDEFIGDQWVDINNNPKVITLSYGDGFVVVVADSSIWENDEILYFDHAYLLEHVIPSNRPVTILYGAYTYNLWQRIFNTFPEACIAFAIMLLIWLWQKSLRAGPITEVSIQQRRALSEHIRASGQYFWRSAQPQQLIIIARQWLFKRIQRTTAHFTAQSQTEQLAYLTQQTQIPEAELEKALFNEPARLPPAEFTRTMNTMAKIRKAL